MNVIIVLVIIVACLIIMGLTYLGVKISEKFRLIFGYKKYEYTKILSHGMENAYAWHKTDEKALNGCSYFDFIVMIKPERKRIKPIN